MFKAVRKLKLVAEAGPRCNRLHIQVGVQQHRTGGVDAADQAIPPGRDADRRSKLFAKGLVGHAYVGGNGGKVKVEMQIC